ncbi:aquaporin-11 isoform X2 [Lutzomyia longipalpis]|uniref:Aquaporin n=1 Tax=Lutzomyia longipalpis TaxID=7200 RepID=A0A1B0GHS5_LUTLO|nr:aquaporin-11 isoform X2 [Lutzomyia longipalpis]XP_055692427.1 aquaporin-11 isoform X2 [Lutzomyia longipalpis]
MSLPALLVSTGYMGISCALAQTARKLTSRMVKEGLVQELFFEAIAAAELCACCFELIIVADNFGVATYAIYLFLLTVWWSQVWGDATACPYTHMEDMVEGKTSPRNVALKTWAQLMGGCCVFRFVQVLWWLELASTHEGRAFAECTADLQVNPYLGAIIEGIATLLCRLASRSLGELGPKHATLIDSFIGTSLVVAAFNLSGGYFNPVLATALKWGCTGHTNIEHIIVYWIGACVGAVLSVPLFKLPTVHSILVGDAKSKDE